VSTDLSAYLGLASGATYEALYSLPVVRPSFSL
jgi:hypothetical protein